jgi:hypothetical protein
LQPFDTIAVFPATSKDMATKSPLLRFLVIAGILLGLIAACLVLIWNLTWSEPQAAPSSPAPTAIAISPSQPQPTTPVAGTIGGTVQDENKNPVRGAKIRVYWNERGATGDARPTYHNKTVTTDGQGQWNVAGVKTDALIDVSLTFTDRDYAQLQVYGVPLADVTAHSLVTVLKRGIDISGLVVNSTGAAIANATITSKRTHYDNIGQTVHSDGKGKFALQHLPADYLALTIIAPNYAPQQIENPGAQPLKVVMKPGQTIRGRVVDPKGVPLKGVEVMLQRWGRAFQAVDLHATTDAKGKFTLEHVPDDSVTLDIGKQGYQDSEINYDPGDPALAVTLPLLVTFSGKVVDVDTGKPIPTFNVFVGAHWPGWTSAIFELGVRPQNTFHDGVYKLQGTGFGGTILAWYVRIEADGYYPQIGNPARDGGNAPQDFQLRPGPDLSGTLVDPDGKPVPKVPIVRLLPCSSVNVSNGEYEDSGFATQQATDAQGVFHLRPQIGPIELWAMTKTGVAERRQTGSDGTPVTLKLTPWASVHVHSSTRPTSPDERWNLNLTPGGDPSNPLNFSHWNYSATPTAGGDVTFDRVPAIGDGLVAMSVNFAKESNPSMLVHLTPGKTTDIDLTGGITLTGRFIADNGTTRPSVQYAGISLQRLPDGPPSKWPVDWTSAVASQPIDFGYFGSIDQDGEFSVHGLVPGKYEYSSSGAYGLNSISCGLLNIPEDKPTFDAGSLPYAKQKPLNVGDPAPAVLGRTLDDQPIKSSDFSGKYVVCFFWSNSFGGVSPTDAQLLLPFAGDKRVALVAINKERAYNERPPMPPGTLPGNAWINGYISDVDLPLLASINFFKDADPPLLFIIAPDGKIAAMNIGIDKIPSTLQQMIAAQH